MNAILIIILQVFLFQFIVIAVIIFILKKILDRMLIESAIKKFEFFDLDPQEQKPEKILVITHKKLKDKYHQKISAIVAKRLHRSIPVVSLIDKKIFGGMVIQVQDIKIDFSLISRLKESGMIRP